MLGGCLFSTRYTMQADVYKKVRAASKSGQVKYSWTLDTSVGNNGVVECIVTPFLADSFTQRGTDEVWGGERHRTVEFLKFISSHDLSRSAQITNIRDKATQTLVYTETDLDGYPATWFNSDGAAPRIDPFGRITEYEILLTRAEQQGGSSV